MTLYISLAYLLGIQSSSEGPSLEKKYIRNRP